ncbi:hypothetical protein FTX61_02550 [Nitriliruptoraceae bacterium ZYF776]|nr:hypothetical protein [Profundirhabdus halotolerans]
MSCALFLTITGGSARAGGCDQRGYRRRDGPRCGSDLRTALPGGPPPSVGVGPRARPGRGEGEAERSSTD